MIQAGDFIHGEITGGSNQLGYFEVSIGGSSPFLKVPAAHRKDQYFVGMDCVLGFINTDSPIIVSRGFRRSLPSFSTPITMNAYPWQCFGRDAWNTNMSDYAFSWDTVNPFAWEQTCADAKNAVVAIIGGKDYIYFSSITAAVCYDEDHTLIWNQTLPTITLPGTVSSAYSFLSDGKFYAVRLVKNNPVFYSVSDVYEYETGAYIGQIVGTGATGGSIDVFLTKPTSNGEVTDGYDEHTFATWTDEHYVDGNFTTVAGSGRIYPAIYQASDYLSQWVNIGGKIIASTLGEVDIGYQYLTALNPADMSTVNEIEYPHIYDWPFGYFKDGEQDTEYIQYIMSAKDEYGSYIYVYTNGIKLNVTETTEIIGADTYITTIAIYDYAKYLYTYDENLTQKNKIKYSLYSGTRTIVVKNGTTISDTGFPTVTGTILWKPYAIIDTKNILCVWHDSTEIKMGILNPSTGSFLEIVNDWTPYYLYDYGISDSNNNSIFYGTGNTIGFDSSGTLLFNKSLTINTIAAGQNGVYGINTTTQKLYRL